MTKATVELPERWVDDLSADGEGRLGDLFRAVAEPEPLPAATLARIHAGLAAGRGASAWRRRVREAVLAAVMVLAGSSLALAGYGSNEWWRARHAPQATKLMSLSAGAAHASKSSKARRTIPPAAPAPGEEIADAGLADTASGVPHAAFTKLTDRGSSALGAESQALQAVLVKLRREHDAQGALTLLDQAQPLFEHGALALEAQVARVDALLALGKRADALEILNHLPFAQIGRGAELHLLRAELRARQDCGLALADFDALLTQSLAGPLQERTLYGRAACEEQVGDAAHAQQDFDDCLARFPDGRFAGSVRRELARLPSKAQ